MKKQTHPSKLWGGRERVVMSAVENVAFELWGWVCRRVLARAIWAGEMSFARTRALEERSWVVVRPGPQPRSRYFFGDFSGDDPGGGDDDDDPGDDPGDDGFEVC